MSRILKILVILPFLLVPVKAEIIHIPEDFFTIQDGISTAMDGDTVLVSPGRYVENIDFLGKNITVASLILTTENRAYIDSTIIDGDSVDCAVAFVNAESDSAILRGFTITRGIQDFGGGIDVQMDANPQLLDLLVTGNWANSIGAGIYCTWYSAPTIRNVEIRDNISGAEGGGFGSAHEATPLLQDVTITDNSAETNGGGVFAGHGAGNVIMENCQITGNWAGSRGGGIAIFDSDNTRLTDVSLLFNECESSGGVFIDYADPLLENCIIMANIGRGITCWYDAEPVIRGCFIAKNTAEEGCGIYCYEDSRVTIERTIITEHADAYGSGLFCQDATVFLMNSTIFNNTVPENAGDGIISVRKSHLFILNSIIWNENCSQVYVEADTAVQNLVISHSDVMGGEERISGRGNYELSWLEGNIDADPDLAVDDWDNYPDLFASSPCVDRGTDLFVWEQDTLLHIPRDEYYSRAPDMGAIESEYVNSVYSPTVQPESYRLLSCYPNPFNGSTRIRFFLDARESVNFSLFDNSGRMVRSRSGVFEKGAAEFWPDFGGLTSGTYMLRMKSSRGDDAILLHHMK